MAKKPPHELAIRLEDVRQVRGLTGSEMSRRLKINPSTWTRLVAGDVQPSLRVVQEAIAAFPEVRSFCSELLRIRIETDDLHQNEPAEVA